MKLIELYVKNFRSIAGDGVTLSLDDSDIIFLFGQNNAGKSSILSAYEFLVSPKKKSELSDFLGFDTNNQIEIKGTFLKEESDQADFEAKGFNKWVNGDGRIRFRKTWNSTENEGQKETWDPENEGYVNDGFGGLEQHLTRHAPTPIRIPAFPTTAELTKFIKDTIQKSVLKTLKEEETVAYNKALDEIKLLQDRVIGKDSITEKSSQANTNFQKIFPDLTLNISPIEGQEIDLASMFDKEFSVIITDDKFPDKKQNFLHHGHGVIRQTLFNFIGLVKNHLPTVEHVENNHKDFIILFEEPEVYLHPKAIRLLRKVLYDLCSISPFQLICSSHSPSLIDVSRPHTSLVRLVKTGDNITMLYQAGESLFHSTAEIKQQVQMINRFNPNVCESFFADEVILVEGDTEAIVIRELLEKYYPTQDVFVVNTGSKNNIVFFQKILNHFRIKQHIIHDSDLRYLYKVETNDNGDREYAVKTNQDGSSKVNSAWSINNAIWEEINAGNAIQAGLSRRYVSIRDFESSHSYTYSADKGKPLSAYEFAIGIEQEDNVSILNFVKQIVGVEAYQLEFTPAELDELVIEPD